jgi:membrane protein implicated in regulation of membrane protease activity
MQDVAVFYSMYPMWTWLAVGAALLALETATGSGYLLWPAVAAGMVAVMTLAVHLGAPLEAVVFSVLTIAMTVLARRYWPPRPRHHGHDMNDRGARLIGRFGETVGPFAGGQGRVFVDGAEWTAELEDDEPDPIAPGARVRVVEVVDGGRLKVREA